MPTPPPLTCCASRSTARRASDAVDTTGVGVGIDSANPIAACTTRKETKHTFGRVGEHAQALAERLGKGPVNIVIEDNGMRLDPATWAPIWASLTHAVRNAVDHGIEEADVRAEAGKPKAILQRGARQRRRHRDQR